MRHASPQTLDHLEPLLARVRDLDALSEKRRGTFYRKTRACLHFHEDPSGLYADLRVEGDDFDRLKIGASAQQDALIARIKAAFSA